MPYFLDHIDLRVADLSVVQAFYDQLLPALGFLKCYAAQGWLGYESKCSAAQSVPTQFFGICQESTHLPNLNRIAFGASSTEEVDRIAVIAKIAGAQNIEGPEFCPEYGEGYYAMFFEDPSGNRLEVCSRKKSIAE